MQVLVVPVAAFASELRLLYFPGSQRFIMLFYLELRASAGIPLEDKVSMNT